MICIAERVDEEESSNESGTDEYKSKFVLYSGHKSGDIEVECFELAKRIIRKYNQKYVKKTFEFEEVVTDLSKCHVEVSYNLNHFG